MRGRFRLRDAQTGAKFLLASATVGALGASLFGVWGMALSIYMLELGFTSAEIGWVVGSFGYSSIFALAVSGLLADRYGRKRMLIASVLLSAAGTSLFLAGTGFYLFLAASAVLGLSQSFYGPSLMALLAGKTGEDERKYIFSYQSFLNTMGVAGGFILSGFIPDSLTRIYGLPTVVGLRLLVAISVLVLFLQVVFIFFVRDDGEKVSRWNLRTASWGTIGKFALSSAVIGFGAGVLIPWFPVIFREGWGLELSTVGVIMTFGQVIMSFSFLVVPRIADRLGSISTIAVTEVLAIVALVVMPFSGALWFFVFLYFFRMTLMMMSSPIYMSFMMAKVRPEERATAQSISAFGWNISWAVSQSISGYIWANNYTSDVPFYICAVFYTLHLLLFMFFFAGSEDKRGNSIAGNVNSVFNALRSKMR